MRIYIPATLPDLAGLQAAGRFAVSPLPATAVTPALVAIEGGPRADAEELEYAAMSDAAYESLLLLAERAGAPRRRVVVAADVPDATVETDGTRGASGVLVNGPVALSVLASIHLDEPDVAELVSAAAAALDDVEDESDSDALNRAEAALDALDDQELLWYGVQELPYLID
jgi:uncharacterized protein DUF6912